MAMADIVLRSSDLHWIDRADDNPSDQCVHGELELSVNGTTFVAPTGGDWNLTAAGLFLLRTATDNNTTSESVCPDNFLIPCCGFNPWIVDGFRYPLLIQGCNRGVNILVEHLADGIRLASDDGVCVQLSKAEWCSAVLGFTSQIESWYARNPPRAEPGDKHDAEGWEELWREWKSRSEAVRVAI